MAFPDNYFDFVSGFRLKVGSTFRHVLTFYDELTAAEIAAVENNRITTTIQASLNIKKADLSGYTSGVMQVRNESGTLILELSTTDGTLSINTTNSTVTVELAAGDSVGLAVGEHRYDMLLIASATERDRVLQGVFSIDGGVTDPS